MTYYVLPTLYKSVHQIIPGQGHPQRLLIRPTQGKAVLGDRILMSRSKLAQKSPTHSIMPECATLNPFLNHISFSFFLLLHSSMDLWGGDKLSPLCPFIDCTFSAGKLGESLSFYLLSSDRGKNRFLA